jgi:hypothetical protein
MAKEPALVFKLSDPQTFRCSACNGESQGDFAAEGWAVDVVDAFRIHVLRYHSKGQDFSQPASLMVTEASKESVSFGRTGGITIARSLKRPDHNRSKVKN